MNVVRDITLRHNDDALFQGVWPMAPTETVLATKGGTGVGAGMARAGAQEPKSVDLAVWLKKEKIA